MTTQTVLRREVTFKCYQTSLPPSIKLGCLKIIYSNALRTTKQTLICQKLIKETLWVTLNLFPAFF